LTGTNTIIDRAEYLVEQFGRAAEQPVSQFGSQEDKEQTLLGLLGSIVAVAETCSREVGVAKAVSFIEQSMNIATLHGDCRKVRNAAVLAAVRFGADPGIHIV